MLGKRRTSLVGVNVRLDESVSFVKVKGFCSHVAALGSDRGQRRDGLEVGR